MSYSLIPIAGQGPILSVQVGVSKERLEALDAANIKIPDPRIAHMLVDTGASSTTLDEDIVSLLSLQETGFTKVHTPSTGDTPVRMKKYDISMVIRGTGAQSHVIPNMSVTGSFFQGQDGIDGLIGRDILSNCHMTYDGISNSMILTFP